MKIKHKVLLLLSSLALTVILRVIYFIIKLQQRPALTPIPEGMRAWFIIFTRSYYYPPSMISAHGENKEEGWGSGLLRARAARANRFPTVLKRMRFMLDNPTYDGFGIVLQGAVDGIAIPNRINLPSKIYIRWQSLYDYTVYNTIIPISEEVRKNAFPTSL